MKMRFCHCPEHSIQACRGQKRRDCIAKQKREKEQDEGYLTLKSTAQELFQQAEKRGYVEAVKRIGGTSIDMRGHKRTTEYQEKSPEAWLLGRLAHLEKNDNRALILELIRKEVEVLKANNPY